MRLDASHCPWTCLSQAELCILSLILHKNVRTPLSESCNYSMFMKCHYKGIWNVIPSNFRKSNMTAADFCHYMNTERLLIQ